MPSGRASHRAGCRDGTGSVATDRQLAVPGGNLILHLFVLQQRVGEFMEVALRGTDVRPSEFAVYSQLGESAMTPREISLRLGLDGPPPPRPPVARQRP